MRATFLLPALVSVSAVLKSSYDKLYGSGAPDEKSADSLAASFERTNDSLRRLLDNTYLVFGSSVLGMIVDPPEPEQQADRLFEEFHACYNEFITEFRGLILAIRESSDDVHERLGDNWKSLDSVGGIFEKNSIEWEDVLSGTWVSATGHIRNNPRVFCSSLAGRFMEFLGEEAGFGRTEARLPGAPEDTDKNNYS